MYRYALPFLFILVVACSSEDAKSNADEHTLTPQEAEMYSSWRTGQFYYKVRPFGLFLVNRYDTLQEEFIKKNGMITEFKVNWLNDSMYELRFHRIAENPQNISLPDGVDSLVKVCTMTDVSDTMYIEKAMGNLTDSHIYTKYRRPKTVQTKSPANY